MKKILTTLTVIAAAALGAQGQTTIGIPNTGSSSLTNLTVETASFTPPSNRQFTQARLIFGASGIPAGVTVTFAGTVLTGDGITSSLSYPNVILDSVDTELTTDWQNLNSNVATWSPDDTRVSFNIQINGGALTEFSSIIYEVSYASLTFSQLNTAAGTVNIVAVPEPSAYAAAAGLLALFLWSSRRHLFKLAGARSSSASGPGDNGAA